MNGEVFLLEHKGKTITGLDKTFQKLTHIIFETTTIKHLSNN